MTVIPQAPQFMPMDSPDLRRRKLQKLASIANLIAGELASLTLGGGTGTVTSVGVSGGGTGFAFSGGPITTSGTITLSIANQATARTALGLAPVAASGAYADLTGRPANVSAFANDAGYITSVVGALGFTPEDTAARNVAGGYAGLDGGGKVPAALLPSYVDDVLAFASIGAFPAVGESGKIYVSEATDFQYRWNGSGYTMLLASPGSTDAVPEGAVNLYHTALRARGAIGAAAPLSYDAGTGVVSLPVPGGTSQFLRSDGTWAAPAGAGAINVRSAITSVTAGAMLFFTLNPSNPTYPGGEFILDQVVVSLTVTAKWVASNSSAKPGYTTFPGTVNTENISLTLTLSGATFAVQASDTITIGATTITGADLLALGITGTGGTYTIPSSLLAAGIQTAASSAVSVNLTTSVLQVNRTGTTLRAYKQPTFWQTTASATPPSWTTANSHNTTDFAFGDGASSSATTTNYLWIAVPVTASSFKYVFLGADNFITPSVTSTTTLYGIAYNVYGFTGFGSSVFVQVVS